MDGRNLFKGAHGTVNSVRITAFVSSTRGRKRRAVRQKRQKGGARFRRKPRLIDKIAEGVAMGLIRACSEFCESWCFFRQTSVQGYKRQRATL